MCTNENAQTPPRPNKSKLRRRPFKILVITVLVAAAFALAVVGFLAWLLVPDAQVVADLAVPAAATRQEWAGSATPPGGC